VDISVSRPSLSGFAVSTSRALIGFLFRVQELYQRGRGLGEGAFIGLGREIFDDKDPISLVTSTNTTRLDAIEAVRALLTTTNLPLSTGVTAFASSGHADHGSWRRP
jgi:hypothetical protein